MKECLFPSKTRSRDPGTLPLPDFVASILTCVCGGVHACVYFGRQLSDGGTMITT